MASGLTWSRSSRRTSDCSCGRVGMKVNTNHGPIPKSIRRCPSAETSAETGGGGPRTNGVWRSLQTVYPRRHRQYLALGGLGFLLGDGNLSDGPQEIMETYYNFPVPLRPGV